MDAYWFPAMAVYPDVESPTVTIADHTIAQGGEAVISLLEAVDDADNMAALAVTTAVSADGSVARAVVRGLDLIVTAVAPGQTVVTVTTDSNGRLATCSFMVTVTGATVAGDVNATAISALPMSPCLSM